MSGQSVSVVWPALFAHFSNSGYVLTATMSAEPAISAAETSGLRPAPERVTAVRQEPGKIICTCSSGALLALSRLIGSQVRVGDEISATTAAVPEILVRKPTLRRADRYHARVGNATLPRPDRRGEMFVRLAVAAGQLGMSAIHIPCHSIRDYFFVTDREKPWGSQVSFYRILHVPHAVRFGELRLAYRVRRMEFRQARAQKSEVAVIERAYNMLADPQLRAVYETLLSNPETPTPFPYSGFGSVLVEGEQAKEGDVFFARRILAFLPELRRQTLTLPLRKVDLFGDYAVLRDRSRKLEILLDQQLLPLRWDQTWNQWRRLLNANIEITADFVHTGKYQKRKGEWHLIEWETALPSRTDVKLPGDLESLVLIARRQYSRIGRHFAQIDLLRQQIERIPMESGELRRVCWDRGLPGDFDVAQLSWQPGYDPFYYEQLSKRARTMYLFRDEFIFDLSRAVVVEIPQAGHAAYIFEKPERLDEWVKKYMKTTRQEILANRNNIAESLGFLGRIVHGANKTEWIRDLAARIRELPMDGSVVNTHDP